MDVPCSVDGHRQEVASLQRQRQRRTFTFLSRCTWGPQATGAAWWQPLNCCKYLHLGSSWHAAYALPAYQKNMAQLQPHGGTTKQQGPPTATQPPRTWKLSCFSVFESSSPSRVECTAPTCTGVGWQDNAQMIAERNPHPSSPDPVLPHSLHACQAAGSTGSPAPPSSAPYLPHHVLAAPVGVDEGEADPRHGPPRRRLHLLHKVAQLAARHTDVVESSTPAFQRGRDNSACCHRQNAETPVAAWMRRQRDGSSSGTTSSTATPSKQRQSQPLFEHCASAAPPHRSVASIHVYTCTSSLGSSPRRAKSSSWWCAPRRGNTRSSSGHTCAGRERVMGGGGMGSGSGASEKPWL